MLNLFSLVILSSYYVTTQFFILCGVCLEKYFDMLHINRFTLSEHGNREVLVPSKCT